LENKSEDFCGCISFQTLLFIEAAILKCPKFEFRTGLSVCLWGECSGNLFGNSHFCANSFAATTGV